MAYRLEHVAIRCKDLQSTIGFYERLFGGTPTEIRKGSAGYAFCFVRIDGAPAIQLLESPEGAGVHHYGFVADDIDQAVKDLKANGATIVRENRDAAGRLTTVFLQDPNGLEIEVRTPR